MLDIAPYFLIYVTLFRLAIIAAGVISIVLGYRLFCKGIWPDQGEQGAAFDAKIAGANFTLKNAAPGTFFALFGVIIISFMLSGMPEFTLETVNQATSDEMGEKTPEITAKTPPTRILKMRGDDEKPDEKKTVEAFTQICQEHYENGKNDEAIKACHQAVSLATDALNMLAWLYQEQEKFTEAQALANAAVTMAPKYTEALHTLAIILCKTEQHDKAQHWIKQAIDSETDPDEKDELNDLLESFKEGQCELDE